jgi:dihydrofolate synthase/folylpolyglutamate synthase
MALDDYFPMIPVVLVFGASEDKDIDGMISELLPRLRSVVATQAVHPRAIDPNKLVDMVHQHGRPARAIPKAADAFIEAVHLAGEDALVLAAGSIFLAAETRTAWSNLQQEKASIGRDK